MLDSKASNLVRIAKKNRRDQYNTFVENRLHNASASVYENVKKSNLPLFGQKNPIVSSKSKQHLFSYH